MNRPITPSEARAGRLLPEAVTEVINRILAERYFQVSVKISENELIQALEGHEDGFDFDAVSSSIIGAYETAGWRVSYFENLDSLDNGPLGEAGWVFRS